MELENIRDPRKTKNEGADRASTRCLNIATYLYSQDISLSARDFSCRSEISTAITR